LSPSVLYDRLRELREAGLIGRRGQDYALTSLGRALGDAIAPLDAWSKRWAKEIE
jgi:DNA-binding HxlR family transcriptional regulator